MADVRAAACRRAGRKHNADLWRRIAVLSANSRSPQARLSMSNQTTRSDPRSLDVRCSTFGVRRLLPAALLSLVLGIRPSAPRRRDRRDAAIIQWPGSYGLARDPLRGGGRGWRPGAQVGQRPGADRNCRGMATLYWNWTGGPPRTGCTTFSGLFFRSELPVDRKKRLAAGAINATCRRARKGTSPT